MVPDCRKDRVQDREPIGPLGWYVAKGSTYITIEDLLAHEDGWLDAIQGFTRATEDALKDQ